MPSAEPDVSIIIPVLDPGELLTGCLAALGHADDFEVIVVDNGSADGSVAEAQVAFPHVRLIRNARNEGFARACNQGAKEARGRYLLFLNSDARVSADGVRSLTSIADVDPASALWGPVIVAPDGSADNSGEYITWAGFFMRAKRLPALDEAAYPAFSCTAACALVRADVFGMLGGFNESYFAYVEDVDLCWRARLRGWGVRIVPSVRCVHAKSSTTRRFFYPHEVRYMSFRNRFRTILANGSPLTLVRIVPRYAAICLAWSLVYLLTGRWRSTAAVFRALIWPLVHGKEMTAQRRFAQAERSLSDSDLIRAPLRVPFLNMMGLRLLREHYRHWESAPNPIRPRGAT